MSIDLEPYNIYIPDEEFFVAVEWLRISENYGILKSPLFGNHEGYNPVIGGKEIEDSDKYKGWLKIFTGEWIPQTNRYFISATVK